MRRLCAQPGCYLSPTSGGRCSKHRRRAATRTPNASPRLYDRKAWKILRRRVLFEQPLCSCGDLAVDVHHRHALADGGAELSRENLEALCRSCHSRQTRLEQLALAPARVGEGRAA